MRTASIFGFLSTLRDQSVAEARDLLALDRSGAGLSLRNLDDLESRLDDASRAAERLDRLVISVGREPLTYQERGEHSFFMDQASAKMASGASEEARGRLQRHAQEMDVELERRDALARREFNTVADHFGMKRRERRDLTRVAGSAGNFVPPLWMMEELGAFPRAGRVLADRVTSVPLPKGTISVSVPRITTGTATAVQATDNAVVQETDLIDNVATGAVRTIAGQVDAAIQLAEQSARPGFDRVVFDDLAADYDTKLETQLIAGTGAAGQLPGLLTSPGTTVTYTSATPTVAATYSRIGDLASQVSTARQRVPSVALLAPRRAFWLMSQADGQSRPVNPVDLGAPERDANVEPVGSLLGMAMVLDPAIPTNLGAGAEDRIIVTRAADHLLLEGDPFLTTNIDVLSGTLTARFAFRRYVAFISQRAPSATGVLAGTGLTAPAFA